MQVPKQGELFGGKVWFDRKDATVTLGITSAALEKLGSLESIELPEEGEEYSQGDLIITVEGTHGKLEIVAPATGMIHEVNSAAASEPENVQEDPLEEGWLIKIEVDDPAELREYSGDWAGKAAGSGSDESEDEDSEEDEESDE